MSRSRYRPASAVRDALDALAVGCGLDGMVSRKGGVKRYLGYVLKQLQIRDIPLE